MHERVILLVLLAALLHAVWNALLKGTDDRAQFMARMCSAIGLLALMIVPFFPLPARPAWIYIGISGILHGIYNLLLLKTYRTSDFGSAYPIARGISPLLVTLGGFLFMQQRPTATAVGAIAVISAGIVFLSTEKRGSGKAINLPAMATGASIAAYTVTDGMGVRASGNTISYTAWVFASYLFMPVVLVLLGLRLTALRKGDLFRPVGAAVFSLAAYTLVLWATHYEDVGIVSALRETSVLWAVILSRFFLGEKGSWRRVVSAVMICLGIFVLIAKSS